MDKYTNQHVYIGAILSEFERKVDVPMCEEIYNRMAKDDSSLQFHEALVFWISENGFLTPDQVDEREESEVMVDVGATRGWLTIESRKRKTREESWSVTNQFSIPLQDVYGIELRNGMLDILHKGSYTTFCVAVPKDFRISRVTDLLPSKPRGRGHDRASKRRRPDIRTTSSERKRRCS